ncbi:MAG: DNA polymerase III subunit delta [Treponema sp.]|nr:DNA polymerase III subunit delta [Treponema sp.]
MGPELGEKQTALDELRKKFRSEPEETVYYAGETAAGEIVAALRNGSLFSESRLFIIKSAENFKKKDEIDLLASYMVNPQNDTVLVLLSEENSIAKQLEKAVPPQAKRVFYELSDQKKAAWVRDFFTGSGLKITPDGVLTVLEMVENNTAALKGECARLILFFNKGDELGPAEVEKWLSHTREESAFTLFSRIADGDFSRSLQSLRVLLAAKTEPQAILAGLLWCFRKLRDYVNLSESGVTDEWEYKKIGVIAPQARRDYSGAARLYDSAAVETCISLTAEYDYKIRAAGVFPKQILLDDYLYKIHSSAVSRDR